MRVLGSESTLDSSCDVRESYITEAQRGQGAQLRSHRRQWLSPDPQVASAHCGTGGFIFFARMDLGVTWVSLCSQVSLGDLKQDNGSQDNEQPLRPASPVTAGPQRSQSFCKDKREGLIVVSDRGTA
jgi:hypothetical protein